jgi:O-antigen ligase
VFDDPNDFSMVLILAAIVGAYGLGERRLGRLRWMLLLPIAFFGYALVLTHSRGGVVAGTAALLVFVHARFGWRNVLPLALLLLPLLLLPDWGRQTSFNLGDAEDTFQRRIELWYNSLSVFRAAPLFGSGRNTLVDIIGQVTHNSYLHAFAEMGLLGGVAFTGAFYLVLRGLRLASPADAEVARLRPYVLAMTAGYAAGLLSLSRCYTVPTQLVLALATAYLLLASRGGPRVVPSLDWRCARRVTAAGLVMLVVTYAFIMLVLLRGTS